MRREASSETRVSADGHLLVRRVLRGEAVLYELALSRSHTLEDICFLDIAEAGAPLIPGE